MATKVVTAMPEMGRSYSPTLLFGFFESANKLHVIIIEYMGEHVETYLKKLKDFEIIETEKVQKASKIALDLFFQSKIPQDVQQHALQAMFRSCCLFLQPQLLIAMQKGEEGAVTLFLESGVKPTEEILMDGMKNKCSEVVIQKILNAGVKVNQTAAELACELGYLCVVKAYYSSANKPSKTMFELAVNKGFESIYNYFMHIGVQQDGRNVTIVIPAPQPPTQTKSSSVSVVGYLYSFIGGTTINTTSDSHFK